MMLTCCQATLRNQEFVAPKIERRQETLSMSQSKSWRQILKKHSDSFLSWLDETKYECESLDRLAAQLSEFLIARIRSEADARDFWNAIPCVRAACNDPCTYQRPWAAEAYAYEHLLRRYCRTWAVLKYLTAERVLPLGSQGVRVLDVGTGPAPALYAIDDFYSALGRFAQESEIQDLCIPPPELGCIENSQAMVRFMHHFSEHCKRQGPFGPTINDFTALDLRAKRRTYFENNRYKTYWDDDTEEYEDWDDSDLTAQEGSSLFRYRMIIFSNFLTLGDTVSQFEEELRALFDDLRPGSVVTILGATGDNYQTIYRRLAQMAGDAQMRNDEWNTDGLGNQIDEGFRVRIKCAQHAVYLHLESLAKDPPLPQTNPWPDHGTPKLSKKARSNFALRVFRRGKWPKEKSTRKP